MQIQSHLSGDSARSNILKKPDHILSFVKHALESAFEPPKSAVQGSRGHHGGLNVEDLRIVDTPEEEVDGDSDDEDLPGGSGNGDEEMTVTAINLLLSILEGMYSHHIGIHLPHSCRGLNSKSGYVHK